MRFIARALTAAFCLCLTNAAHSADSALNLEQARKLSTSQLAERLLGASGRMMRESQVSDGTGGFNGRPWLASVNFAASPVSAGFDGICEADTATVLFKMDDAYPSATTQVEVKTFYTGRVFMIVPALLDMPNSDKTWHALERACGKTGPVLTRWREPKRRGFFSGFVDDRGQLEAVDVHFAARALTSARRALPAASPQITCTVDPTTPNDPLCANASATLAGLDWSHLVVVSLSWCDDSRTTRCVKLEFDREAISSNVNQRTIVTLATDTGRIDPPTQSIGIRAISVAGETSVDD